MHQHLLDNLHLATSVFMMGDLHAARTLLAEKDRMRDLEQAATANHLRRLRKGRPQSIETSTLHLDIARDLKRIAAHITSVAYPILEQGGALRRSRLLDDGENAGDGPGGGKPCKGSLKSARQVTGTAPPRAFVILDADRRNPMLSRCPGGVLCRRAGVRRGPGYDWKT